MSVLNQMLRDLEQRRGQSASSSNPALRDLREPPQSTSGQAQRFLLPLLIGLVLLLSLALAWALLLRSSDPQPQPTPALSAQPATPVAMPQPQVLTPPTETASSGGQIERQETAIIEQPLLEGVSTPASQAPPETAAQPKPVEQPPRIADAPQQTQLAQADATPAPERTAPSTAATETDPQQTSDSDSSTNAGADGVRRSDQDDPLARALSHWQAGRSQQAERLLAQQLEQRPDWHQARLHYAQLLLQQQRSDAAVKLLQAGLRLDPGTLELRSLLARSQQSLGQVEAAIATLEAAPELDQSNALLLLAALYQQQQRYEQAHQRYRQALELDADQGRGWAGLAISLEALGEHEQAIEAWQQALARSDLPVGLRRYGRERLDSLDRR